jgi:hypothetical protein
VEIPDKNQCNKYNPEKLAPEYLWKNSVGILDITSTLGRYGFLSCHPIEPSAESESDVGS